MALINCKECNNEISSKAKTCPKCGARNTPGIRWGKLFLIASAVTLFLVIVGYKPPKAPEAAAIAPESEATSAAQPAIDNSWTYQTNTDTVSGKQYAIASILSNNTEQLDFPYKGGTYAHLIIRYHPRYGQDLIFQTNNGQLNCEYDNCYINMRYDNGPVIKNYVSEPADNSSTSYFLSKFKTNLEKLKNSKKVYIEVTFYRQGSHTFVFNTENLDTVKLALLK